MVVTSTTLLFPDLPPVKLPETVRGVRVYGIYLVRLTGNWSPSWDFWPQFANSPCKLIFRRPPHTWNRLKQLNTNTISPLFFNFYFRRCRDLGSDPFRQALSSSLKPGIKGPIFLIFLQPQDLQKMIYPSQVLNHPTEMPRWLRREQSSDYGNIPSRSQFPSHSQAIHFHPMKPTARWAVQQVICDLPPSATNF